MSPAFQAVQQGFESPYPLQFMPRTLGSVPVSKTDRWGSTPYRGAILDRWISGEIPRLSPLRDGFDPRTVFQTGARVPSRREAGLQETPGFGELYRYGDGPGCNPGASARKVRFLGAPPLLAFSTQGECAPLLTENEAGSIPAAPAN